MNTIPLFEEYPRLAERLPRIALGAWPTPVQRLEKLERAIGLPSLWVKREDQSDPECGGNKLRGLEFLLADALARGASTVLTVGAAGSFHVRATVLAAQRVGLRTTALLLPQALAGYVRENLAIAHSAGARLIPVRAPWLPLAFAREYLRDHTAAREHAHLAVARRSPCVIAPGGTSPLSCIGQVNAAFELRQDIRNGRLPEPSFLFVPLGSLGTAAGLMLGCKLAGLKTRVVGVVVFSRWYCTARRCARLAGRTNRLLSSLDPAIADAAVNSRDVIVLRDALGPGYAQFTPEGVAAAAMVRGAAGIPVDGTYTGKMYAGAFAFLRQSTLSPSRTLFWHTYLEACPGRWCEADVERLPRGLRRYFALPPQPLDGQLRPVAEGAIPK